MHCTLAHALPVCAGSAVHTPTDAVRVDPGGALLLRDGGVAHLEGIRFPAGDRDHAPDSFRRGAFSALSSLIRGRRLTLTGVAPLEDRYGRIRVQAFNGDNWVQAQLLTRGLARVSIAPDRVDCAAELYEAEAKARKSHAGLWSSPSYAPRSPAALDRDLGTFQLVEGRVASVSERSGSAWLEFDAPAGSRFAAFIAEDDLRTFRAMGVEPRGYAGRSVRVRGIVQDLSGPAISLANPIQVEVID